MRNLQYEATVPSGLSTKDVSYVFTYHVSHNYTLSSSLRVRPSAIIFLILPFLILPPLYHSVLGLQELSYRYFLVYSVQDSADSYTLPDSPLSLTLLILFLILNSYFYDFSYVRILNDNFGFAVSLTWD